ncbi:MAG: transglutaminase-like domain-containing protein [Tepidisphaeraceae bacterium]
MRDPSKPIRFEAKFEYRTSAYVPKLWERSDAKSQVATRDKNGEAAGFVGERLPHISFSDQVRKLAKEFAGSDTDKVAIAKRIFDWVDDNLAWTPEHEYCLFPNVVEKGLRTRRGDCGIQALTFVTLARCCGIPARWQSGWVTDPWRVGNMHDWAEAWLEPWGWVPIDVSYGKKQHDDPRVRHFYFGAIDSHRLIVNLDYGAALSPAKTSLRSEPLDFQRGEVELDGRNLYFDEWDYEFSSESTEL